MAIYKTFDPTGMSFEEVIEKANKENISIVDIINNYDKKKKETEEKEKKRNTNLASAFYSTVLSTFIDDVSIIIMKTIEDLRNNKINNRQDFIENWKNQFGFYAGKFYDEMERRRKNLELKDEPTIKDKPVIKKELDDEIIKDFLKQFR